MDITSRPVAPVSVLKSLSTAGIVDRPDSVLKPLSVAQPETQNNPLMAESFEKVLSKALEPVNNLQLQSAISTANWRKENWNMSIRRWRWLKKPVWLWI